MKYDLHVHSTYSDGHKSVFELAEEAMSLGLGGFALTDHDTIAGWIDIPQAEQEYGIKIFPAVEISTLKADTDVHILGYGIKNIEPLQQLLSFLENSRRQRVKAILAKIGDLGMPLKEADVFISAGSGTVGRPHIAAALVKNGYVKNHQEAFKKYLGRGKSCYVERAFVAPETVIDYIHQSGGFAVLAHPGLDHVIRFVDELAKSGLDGLEVYHSAHNRVNSQKFAVIAKEYHLAITAGSDYHGNNDFTHGGLGMIALEKADLPYFLNVKE